MLICYIFWSQWLLLLLIVWLIHVGNRNIFLLFVFLCFNFLGNWTPIPRPYEVFFRFLAGYLKTIGQLCSI
jgi:hypothetical protein